MKMAISVYFVYLRYYKAVKVKSLDSSTFRGEHLQLPGFHLHEREYLLKRNLFIKTKRERRVASKRAMGGARKFLGCVQLKKPFTHTVQTIEILS